MHSLNTYIILMLSEIMQNDVKHFIKYANIQFDTDKWVIVYKLENSFAIISTKDTKKLQT